MKLVLFLALAIAAAASTVTIQPSLNSAVLGQTVTFTATVSPSAATGAVTFFDGITILGTGLIANGQATLRTSLLSAGSHSVFAFYGGGQSNAAAASQRVAVIVRSLPDFGFRPVPSSAGNPNNDTIVVADFNNDGIPDLAITDWEILGLVSVQQAELTVLLGNGDGTFRTTFHVVGNGIPAIVAADLNGDGNADIVTFGGVYLGKGDGTFQPPLSLDIETSDAQQTTLAIADFNGDGRADLAWASPVNGQTSGVVGIMLGKGDGTFQPSIQTTIAAGGVIAAGDFNHDGRADVAVTNGANGAYSSLSILLGNGDGTLQTPAVYQLTATPQTIVIADFNGDGRDDIAVGGYAGGQNTTQSDSGVISVLISNPDGSLQPAIAYPIPAPATDLVAGDFNGDGRIDLAAEYGPAGSVAGAALYLMLGNGDGTMQNAVLQPGAWFSTLAVGDFNRDGRTDLAAVSNTGNLDALLGAGAPQGSVVITDVLNAASFTSAIEAGSWVAIMGEDLANTARLWKSSDFNGNNLPTQLDGVSVTIDGIPAYVEYISPTQINVLAPADPATGPVNVVVTNNGYSSAPATAQLQSVAPAFFISPTYDVNASVIPGYIPVTSAAPAMPGDLVVLWCTGFGPTIPPDPIGAIVTGAPATTMTPVVTVGDMTVPVISSVMTPGTVGLYQITIRLPDNVPTGTPAIQASIDGKQTSSGVTLFVGAAAGTPAVKLQSSAAAPTLGQSVTFTATVSPSGAGKVTFFDGVNLLGIIPLANGQATLSTSLLTAGAHSITALFGQSESVPLPVAVHALPGSGFQAVQSGIDFPVAQTIAVADFNHDGIPDLAVGQTTPIQMVGAVISNLAVLLGNGDGTFRVASQLPGLDDSVVVTGDFNGDGITDLATPSYVYLGNGDGTFHDGIPLNLNFNGALNSLAVGDFNGDGRADLAWSGQVNGSSAGMVGVLPGNGDGTFGPSINSNVGNGGSLAIGDFNHDGIADLAMTQGAGIGILLGKGDGTFQTPAIYSLSYPANTLAIADFNGDGRDDVVVGEYSNDSSGNAGPGFIGVFLSNPDGTLQKPTTIQLSTSGPTTLTVGDFNGDGRMDVAYTPYTGALYTILGNGDGTLQSPVAAGATLAGAMAAADFNRDGRTDLAGGIDVVLAQALPQGSAGITVRRQ